MEQLKLPWKYKKNISSFSIFDPDGKTVCKTESGINCSFIVEACNNYERLVGINKELVEALKAALRFIHMDVPINVGGEIISMQLQLKNVIEKAEAK